MAFSTISARLCSALSSSDLARISKNVNSQFDLRYENLSLESQGKNETIKTARTPALVPGEWWPHIPEYVRMQLSVSNDKWWKDFSYSSVDMVKDKSVAVSSPPYCSLREQAGILGWSPKCSQILDHEERAIQLGKPRHQSSETVFTWSLSLWVNAQRSIVKETHPLCW